MHAVFVRVRVRSLPETQKSPKDQKLAYENTHCKSESTLTIHSLASTPFIPKVKFTRCPSTVGSKDTSHQTCIATKQQRILINKLSRPTAVSSSNIDPKTKSIHIHPSIIMSTNSSHKNTENLSHSISITSVADFAKNNANDVKQEEQSQPPAVAAVPPTKESINLCSHTLGAKVLFATDDWFARAENLLLDGPPLFDPNAYCNEGKVMDGWETRRRRQAGHDWCLIHLPLGSVATAATTPEAMDVTRIDLDTAFFTGNHVPKISIETCHVPASVLMTLVSQLPHGLDRLIHGGLQGTGHTPDQVAIAQHVLQTVLPADQYVWKELIPPTALRPGVEETRLHTFSFPLLNNVGSNNSANANAIRVGNLVRVNYFPDGGVARLRLWAQPSAASSDNSSTAISVVPHPKPVFMPVTTSATCTVVAHSTITKEDDVDRLPSRQAVLSLGWTEVSSLEHGGQGVACSNKHYGEPWQLIQPSLGKNMGDGWETARHPDRPSIWNKDPVTGLMDSPLKDWAILKLGRHTSGVTRIILDTRHFRGNYPESVLLEGTCIEDDEQHQNPNDTTEWFPLIPRTRMSPDAEHVFDAHLAQIENATHPVTHVRVSIFPDGGLSRVRIFV
jgi:allantoicase